jgi:hypothetical protein
MELIKKKTYLHADEQEWLESGSGERRTSKTEKALARKTEQWIYTSMVEY